MEIKVDSSKLLTTLLGAAVIAGFAWMWKMNERVARIESPDSMISRVETLEKLIFPIGVEYEVRKRMEIIDPPTLPPPTSTSEHSSGIAPSIEMPPNSPVDPKLREKAEDDIRSMIEQRPIEEVRNRRGKPIEFKKKN